MTTPAVHTHPVLARAHEIEAELQAVSAFAVGLLSTAEKAEALTRFSRIEAEAAAMKLRLLADAGDVAEARGARDAGAWLAHTTRIDHQAARADLRLAEALDQRWSAVAAGLSAGALNTAQAKVIVSALDKLPTDLDPEVLMRAERHLVELGAHHGPHDLRILGAKILEVVAPDIAEARLGEALEREEQRAQDGCSLRIKDLGNGISRITASVPHAVAARLTTYVDAEDSPRVTRARSRGEAFCRLLEHLDPRLLPDHGGDATTVVVTVSLETLTSALGSATIDGGVTGECLISASEARRLACTAKIIPAVLGGRSQPLDLGRARRLYSGAQRKALGLRDRHCRAEGCSIPASWCEAHHLKPWSEGGRTDLADGALLCSHHHHLAHDTRYDMACLATGEFRFHRRT